ncbi:helix-turn-helix domain-containing protein, partial [Enterobacter hormaechei subsp. steigerwaltii]|nr:helix-turn-helix domain-containing protein [Enterobacter hormaechei subsp. steigerwaltii]
MKNSFELISTDPVKFNTWSIKSKLIIIIRKLMIDNKWSQSEAAEKLGISQPRVSNMLNGKLDKFSVDTLLEMVFKMGYKLDMDFTP